MGKNFTLWAVAMCRCPVDTQSVKVPHPPQKASSSFLAIMEWVIPPPCTIRHVPHPTVLKLFVDISSYPTRPWVSRRQIRCLIEVCTLAQHLAPGGNFRNVSEPFGSWVIFVGQTNSVSAACPRLRVEKGRVSFWAYVETPEPVFFQPLGCVCFVWVDCLGILERKQRGGRVRAIEEMLRKGRRGELVACLAGRGG